MKGLCVLMGAGAMPREDQALCLPTRVGLLGQDGTGQGPDAAAGVEL